MNNKFNYIKNIIENTLTSNQFQCLDKDVVSDLVKNTFSNENDREKIKKQILEVLESYVNKKDQA